VVEIIREVAKRAKNVPEEEQRFYCQRSPDPTRNIRGHPHPLKALRRPRVWRAAHHQHRWPRDQNEVVK
jgi:hypothetical protein